MSDHFRHEFTHTLGFGLDDFQVEALDAVDRDRNVLVSAPTGSGKTLIAHYGVGRAIRQGQRAFYTTPLKALSNQKYGELARLYGASRVGLLTGDTSINRDANIIVMTTEVLRNMLLADVERLDDLGLVVLDEVHYLQDPMRGGVWEEVLILTPPPVQFVALSATVGNADFLGEWFASVRGDTAVILERERPITLHNHMAFLRRGQSDVEVVDLLESGRPSHEARRIDNLMKATRKFRRGSQWRASNSPPAPYRSPRRSDLLRALEREDLLPVIVFIFSRAACDDAVGQCRRDGLNFTSYEEKDRIRAIADERLVDFSDDDLVALDFADFLDSLVRGLAAHHAGMVPAFREIVEQCFEANLLSVVFATETLALGVNMPARSVALERFSKYSDAGRKVLTSAEYAQMTGRAGRRGLDDEGHAIVCFTPEVAMSDVSRIALAPPSDLHSSFRPTYNLSANLVNHFDRETALGVVQRSYAQFESDHRPRSGRSLVEQTLSRLHVLERLGYVDGWSLTERGQLLRSVYHESDLLIVESVAAGVLEELEPAELAGVLSCFVFESKRSSRGGHASRSVQTKRRRGLNDRLGPQRRDRISERLGEIRAEFAALTLLESEFAVPHTREPDGRFATVIAAWARGLALGPVLDLADLEVGQTSPGDFVRQAKQVADLCDQVTRLSPRYGVVQVAREAREALMRSVVAGSFTVHQLS